MKLAALQGSYRHKCRRRASSLAIPLQHRLDLNMDNAATGPLLAVLRSYTSPVERMPAVVNFNFMPAQARYSAGRTTSTPFFFSKTTTNFAGFVMLALRPTVCTSSGPS